MNEKQRESLSDLSGLLLQFGNGNLDPEVLNLTDAAVSVVSAMVSEGDGGRRRQLYFAARSLIDGAAAVVSIGQRRAACRNASDALTEYLEQ